MYYSYSRKPTGWEFFVPARTLIAVKLLKEYCNVSSTLVKQLGIVRVATVDLYVCQISTRFYRFWLFVYHTGLHLSYMVMRSSANSIEKTWNSFLSPLTPGHDLDRCYRHYSPPPTTPVKNLGTPHTLTPNITDPMPTSCMNVPPNHHAHLGSSHSPTSDGHNLHHQQD